MPAAIRRKEFPSWSWSGWIAPVAWASTSPLTWDNILPVEVHVVKVDGTTEPLTEDIVKIAFEDDDNVTPVYTYQLRIVAEALYLRFAYLPTRRRPYSRIFNRATGMYKDAMYAAQGTIKTVSSFGKLHLQHHDWLLDITSHVDEELHYALCNHMFEGIVVCKEYVLVTRTKDGMTARIGLMSTHSANPNWYTERHLRLCFPGSRQDVILG
jgi:hypothetical protein